MASTRTKPSSSSSKSKSNASSRKSASRKSGAAKTSAAPASSPVTAGVTPDSVPGATDPRIDQFTQRTDADARYGHMVVVNKGELVTTVDGEERKQDIAGEIGVYDQTYSTDPKTGFPLEVGVLLRNLNTRVTVKYTDIAETDRRGR